MENLIDHLKKVGLTEYEAKAYLALLREHLSTASKLAERSGVPRTRIYSILESLGRKGWIRVYSGAPLLFRVIDPEDVLNRILKTYKATLDSIRQQFGSEANSMKDKFVIRKEEIGLRGIKSEIALAKSVWISNATSELLRELVGNFREDADVRVIMFPGEKCIERENVQCREAEVKIVAILKGQEVPSMSVLLDEDRTFTIVKDPMSDRYIVDEMLYDECSKCFLEWYHLGWGSEEVE